MEFDTALELILSYEDFHILCIFSVKHFWYWKFRETVYTFKDINLLIFFIIDWSAKIYLNFFIEYFTLF